MITSPSREPEVRSPIQVYMILTVPKLYLPHAIRTGIWKTKVDAKKKPRHSWKALWQEIHNAGKFNGERLSVCNFQKVPLSLFLILTILKYNRLQFNHVLHEYPTWRNGLINLLQAMMVIIKNLQRKYLVIERHMLKIQGILLQCLKFN